MNTVRPALHLLCAVLVLVALNDAAPAAVAKKHHAPFTKGQGQLAGGNGIFGQVYSLKSGFNFEILSAKYSLEPYDAYSSFSSGDGKKLLILDIAIKNNQSSDNFFNDEGMFTVEDSTGQLYGSHSQRLVSLGTKGVNTNLRPGQGLGQPALHDPYEEAFQIDSKSRIVKIMVNQTRLGTSESVFRYYIAGATAAEAGAAGNPKNIIASLPKEAQDPTDPSGATALDKGHLALNVYEPSNCFDMALTDFEYSTTATCNGSTPPDGKEFVIATFTAKDPTQESQIDEFQLEGGNSRQWSLETTDGDRLDPAGFLAARRDEPAHHKFEQGDAYSFRVVFLMDKSSTAKDMIVAATGGLKWQYDVPASQ